MSKWEMASLAECLKLSSGKFLPTKHRIEGKYNVYGGNGVTGNHNDYFVNDPTVVIGRVGEYCGCVHTTGEKVWITDNALYVTRFLRDINKEFICYALKSKKLNRHANKSGQPSISQSTILKVQIPLPPVDVQKKIARTLDTATELITLRKKRLAELDNLIKSIFYDIFGDPIVNEKGWNKCKGNDLSEMITVGVVVKPASYYVDSGIPALRSLNIKPNRIDITNLVHFSLEASNGVLAKSILRQGDVVIVRTGMTGTAAVVPRELDGVNCIDLIIVRPKKDILEPHYLVFLLNSEQGKKMVSSHEVGGIQKHFNIGAIKSISFPVPPLSLQNQFAEIVTKIEEQKAFVQKAVDESQYLFDSLMSEYFE